jgi:transposase InsO family protein
MPPPLPALCGPASASAAAWLPREYGARKIWRQLRRGGVVVARCTVERLMRQLGIAGVVRGKPRRTTVADPAKPVPDDLLKRDFTAPAPNVRWVADVKCRRRHLTSYADRRTMPIIPVFVLVIAAVEVRKVGIVS